MPSLITLSPRLIATRYYHKIGEKQADDVLVYEMPEHPQWMAAAEVTDDGKYIILTISEGCDPVNRLYYVPFDETTGIPAPQDFIKIVDNFDAQYANLPFPPLPLELPLPLLSVVC